MSQHKTGVSNLTVEDKKLYRDRRDKGLRGHVGFVTVYRTVKDEKGDDQRVPLGAMTGSQFSRGKHSESRHRARQQWRAFNKRQRKGSSRGE